MQKPFFFFRDGTEVQKQLFDLPEFNFPAGFINPVGLECAVLKVQKKFNEMEMVSCDGVAMKQWFDYDKIPTDDAAELALQLANTTLNHRAYICEARLIHTLDEPGGKAGGKVCHFPFKNTDETGTKTYTSCSHDDVR